MTPAYERLASLYSKLETLLSLTPVIGRVRPWYALAVDSRLSEEWRTYYTQEAEEAAAHEGVFLAEYVGRMAGELFRRQELIYDQRERADRGFRRGAFVSFKGIRLEGGEIHVDR